VGNLWLPRALATLSGIEPYEAMQILTAPRRLPVAMTAAGVHVIGILGRIRTGRPLTVAVRKENAFDQLISEPAR